MAARSRGTAYWRTFVTFVAGGIAVVMVAGCGATGSFAIPSPPPSVSASGELSATLRLARTEVASTLSAAGLRVRDPQVPFRPAESPLVTAAPRAVVQAILPTAPDRGFVMLYEFRDVGSASAAAEEFVSYIGSGPGSVQFPTDGRFTLRQIGAALAFYVWAPSTATDQDGEARIATALASLGQGYAITR